MNKDRFNPIESSNTIKDEYIAYMKSTFDLSDSKLYSKKFDKEIDNRVLYKGPYLDISSVFSKGKSLTTLMADGVLSNGFRHLKALKPNRTLYKHQERAILQATQGKNLIVSTGTGSGKTESFIIPIINYLIRQHEEGKLGPGVRALLLYPMNALANDQVSRIREILNDYPEITYGRYTGETEEKQRSALDKYQKSYGGKPKKNELISREEMRKSPPNILFTNYSMLEYLMIRPNDKTLFMGKDADNWKYIVLDEAHVYNGANGIEVSLLLRRLKAYLQNELQYILTSATLGDGKKDLKDILTFASRLCDAKFDESSIINAIRKPITSDLGKDYIDKNFYSQLAKLNLKSNKEEVLKIINQYVPRTNDNNIEDINSYLYDILKTDKNYYDLMRVSANEHNLEHVKEQLNRFSDWTSQNLVDFIEVATKCKKNGETLFDSRYHMFIRSLEGAFVSLKPNPQIKLSRHKFIDGLVAYEIGVCRYCKSIYIIGYHDQINNVLRQNEDVDLLENYNEWEEKNVDYFLLEKNDESDESEDKQVEEYILCSKCGHIRNSNEINIEPCDCGSQYNNKIYKENKKENSNKLTHCIACDSRGSSNIVRQFFLGKDSATSLLGQFLYNELPNVKYEQKTQKIEADEFGFFTENKVLNTTTMQHKPKQFIAFSDSRQQAAFFAGYFDAEHDRLMRKRIILEGLKDYHNQSVSVKDFVHSINSILKENKLFSYDETNHLKSESWIAILYELLDVDRRYSLEGLGLVSFEYNMNELTEVPQSDYFKGVSLEEFKNMLEVLLHTFRYVPAIDYNEYSKLNDDYLELLDYRKFNNYMALYSNDNKNVKGWLPKRGGNVRLEYVEKALNMDKEAANKFLEKLWEFIEVKGFINYKDNIGFKLDLLRFTIKDGRFAKWYVCKNCHKVTTKNFKNVCPSYKCEGHLYPIDYEDIYSLNFYKKVYNNIPIENISIREHTAQLEREKAAKYQKDFVEKKLNILSCSTTFEMGVDVGELETVFLRNIPPTPANYAQRAGRAGRRIDSAAYVLTYCNLSSHDFNYFEEPNKMIVGSIRPPHFVIENEKLIKRHVFAVAFGEFFSIYPDLCDTVGKFFNSYGIDEFISYLVSKPQNLDKILKKFIPHHIYNTLYKDFKWLNDSVLQNDSYLKIIKHEFNAEITEIEDAIEESKTNEVGYLMDSLKRLRETKLKERIINFLSRKNIIPKYGFPVDNVDLVTQHDRNNKLNRDLSVAISEYAPGSEIIVDKYKITSRYIKKQENFELEMKDFFVCEVCNKLNIRIHGSKDEKICDVCGNKQDFEKTFIVPKFGFIADGSHTKAKTRKPKKSYSGEIHYVGKGNPVNNLSIEIGNINVDLSSTGNDELVIMNENPFFTCDKCGYSKIDMNNSYASSITLNHKNHRGWNCNNQILNKYALAHNFKTDVAKITFDIEMNFDEARSILYGLLEGISLYLDIDRNDIAGTIIKNSSMQTFDFIIFDNVPGGAGHVKRLVDKDEFINTLKSTGSIMDRNCCDPETSCYTCLRNYYNQKIHDKLKRKYVIDFFNKLALTDN